MHHADRTTPTKSRTNPVAEVSEEEIIKSETPIEEFSEENNSETSEELSGDVSCKDAVKMLIDCINNNDLERTMKLSFPDKYCDTIMLIAELESTSLDNLTSGFDEDIPKTIRLAEVISDEPAEDDYMEMLNEIYGDFQIISDYIEQNNKENIDFEKLNEFLSNVSDTSDVKLYSI